MPPAAPIPLAALTLRVQNLEQRVEHWDSQFGKLLSIAGESRDAAVRAADQVFELMGQIRDLKVAIDTRCDERCGAIRRDMKDIRGSIHDHDHDPRHERADELESTTGLMNRDELIDSRQAMKAEIAEMRERLELLSDAEQKREQAERDKRVAERAVAAAETARLNVAREANVLKDQMAKEMRKEKLKSKTSIVLAILGIIGSVLVAAATHYWG